MSASSEYLNTLTRLTQARGEIQAEAIRARAQATAEAQRSNSALFGTTIANIGQMVSQIPQQRAELDRIKNQAAETQLRREQMQREAAREKREDEEDQKLRDLFTNAHQEFQQSQVDAVSQIPLPPGVSAAPGTVTREAIEGFIPQSGAPQSFGLRSDGTYRGPDDAGQFQPINAPTGGQMLPQPINAPTGGVALRKTPFPTPDELLRTVGPKKAIPIINAMAALKTDPQGDPEKSLKILQQVANGLNALPEDLRAQAYPSIVKSFEERGIVKPGMLQADYSPDYWKFIMGTGQEPAKPAAAKVAQITVPGPDGKPVTKFVEETPGAEYPQVPPSVTATNQTETTLAMLAAKGDKDAARALQILKQQRASEGGQEPLVAVMKDGKPVLVRRSQAEGLTPATSREQGRPVTSGDANKLTDLDSALSDLEVLTKTIGKDADATGVSAQIGAALPNAVTNITGWGTDAKKKQAVIDRVKQVIGKSLEGGVLRKEDEAKYMKILPTIGDPPSVVTSKLAGLKSAITQRKSTLLENLSDAGYETSKFQERSAQPAKADPLGIR